MANKRKVLPYVPVEYQPPEQEEQVEQDPQEQLVEDEEQEQLVEDEEHEQVEDEEHEQVEDEEYEDDISEDYQDFLDHEDFEREEWEKKINDQKEDEDTIIQDDELLEKLLDPLAKDQLVTLLKDFVTKYPDLITTLYSQANSNPALRKIFVHGFGWDTTTDTLKTLFSEFGEIEDCKLVTDELSGKSKGYAFIVYKSSIGAKKALKVPYKIISNRTASWQLQCEGPVPVPYPSAPAVVAAPPVSEYTHAPYSPSTYNEHNKHRAPHAPGVYMECLKNHIAAMGGNAVDGCGEFMPPSLSTPSLLCAACGCATGTSTASPHAPPPPPTRHLTSPS